MENSMPVSLQAFAGNFAVVFLLGIQMQYVIRHQAIAAFMVSNLISAASLMGLLAVIGPESTWLTKLLFCVGGACGIVTSIYFNQRSAAWLNRLKSALKIGELQV